MPQMMTKPANISSLDIFCFFNKGSKSDVNKVTDDKQTNATETVDDLMD